MHKHRATKAALAPSDAKPTPEKLSLYQRITDKVSWARGRRPT
jgi:hypothetical protein